MTYADRTTLKIAGRHTIMLGHPHNAHTDGDTFVFFPDANVLSTGDIFTNGHYPNIDFANGGNIKGMIAGAQTYLKLANDKTKIVPGHGPLATKADLAAYLTMLTTARDRMAKLVKDGKSEADVVAAKPFADLDKTWAASDQASTNFIRVVYHSLADKPGAEDGKHDALNPPRSGGKDAQATLRLAASPSRWANTSSTCSTSAYLWCRSNKLTLWLSIERS